MRATLCLISVLVIFERCTCRSLGDSQPVILGPPDGRLNIFALPIGQGDAQVLQCPTGDLHIVDLGSNQWPRGDPNDHSVWGPLEVKAFLAGQENLIRSIVLTHNHYDHYSLFPFVFPTPDSLPGLESLHVSCTPVDLPTKVKTWLNNAWLENKVRTFNNGEKCGPNGTPCDPLDLCSRDPEVKTTVMAANLGQNCHKGNKNMDSIVFKVQMGNHSMLLTGDFEDLSSSKHSGLQTDMVNYWGKELKSTVYKLAHHGADIFANKEVFRKAVSPLAIYVSGDPDRKYRHPRCAIIDSFINETSLCKPQVEDESHPQHCGRQLFPGSIQDHFRCGPHKRDPPIMYSNNEHAVYGTCPDSETIAVLQVSTDGSRWGIKSHYIDVISN